MSEQWDKVNNMTNLKLLGEDIYGRDVPSKIDPTELAKILQFLTAVNINGDGVAAGTLLIVQIVNPGEVLTLWGVQSFWNEVPPPVALPSRGIHIVESNLAVVGGVEALIAIQEAYRNVPNILNLQPIGQIDNRGGAVPRYLLIYMPLTFNGDATNNAAAVWMSATAYFSIES